MKLLYYSPDSYGGLADYAHKQANALADLGVEVVLLCTLGFPAAGRQGNYTIAPLLRELKIQNPQTNKFFKVTTYIRLTLSNVRTLAQFIEDHNFQFVLLGSYVEYLAPLWFGALRRLAQNGVVFGAVVHDPIRDFVLGPLWWHRWSIACGYSFLRETFVHEAIELDTVQPMPQLHTTVIPHGPYQFPKATQLREATRAALNLPTDAKVMLAFGHIRDNKNLDLVIQAMPHHPDVYLLVAGKEQSSSQQLAASYQELAHSLGVADRCRWLVRYIPEVEVANLFNASDLVLLTYSKTFRSASGVLNTAVHYRKPCLASAGAGPLKTAVQTYGLGIWIEPDSLDAVVHGLRQWVEKPTNPEWEKYLKENAWERNAELVIKALLEKN